MDYPTYTRDSSVNIYKLQLSLAMFPSKDLNLTYAQNWNIA